MPSAFIPYGKQDLDDEDLQAVLEVLKSDWLTTGPKVQEFEEVFAQYTGAREAIAVNSGTAALHAAVSALDIQRGDEVLVPAITFAATANCVVYQGGTPVFVDIDANTMLIDLEDVKQKITPKTRAIIAVDYAGQPCHYKQLKVICQQYNLHLISDACHSLGASYEGRKVGSLSDLSCFSFHPVKNMTTGEGGMITTNNSDWAKKMRRFRNHGISTDHRQRQEKGAHYYEMISLGFNYRITDFQCALGLSQLKKIDMFTQRRQAKASYYQQAFAGNPLLKSLQHFPDRTHAYHIYVVRLNLEQLNANREDIFNELRSQGIGVNVHYPVVYLHPFYQTHFNSRPGLCPQAEKVYKEILTLPLYVQMEQNQQEQVIETLKQILNKHAK